MAPNGVALSVLRANKRILFTVEVVQLRLFPACWFSVIPLRILSDVVYGIQPMTTEMAEVIRTLRRDHGVDYVRLGFTFCESDPDTQEVHLGWARRSLTFSYPAAF